MGAPRSQLSWGWRVGDVRDEKPVQKNRDVEGVSQSDDLKSTERLQ